MSAARVEVAQESRDEEMIEPSATSNAENVKLRVEVSREESTEVEDVSPSRKRGSEDAGVPEDPMLEHADGSEMCINEMVVIAMLLGVAPANGKVAEMFCRKSFGGTPVDMGFERGHVVDHVSGWVNNDVGQPKLRAVEQRVAPAGERLCQQESKRHMRARMRQRDKCSRAADMVDKEQMGGEKQVSLIGSPMRQTFCDLIMAMRDANGLSEVKYDNLAERCVKHPDEKGMFEIRRNAGRSFL